MKPTEIKLARRRAIITSFVKSNPGLTAKELRNTIVGSDNLTRNEKRTLNYIEIMRRLSNCPAVIKGAQRKCSILKSTVYTWHVGVVK